MKILTLLGSPRKEGNTSKALKLFEKLVSESCEVEHINITDYEINGCLGCGSCKKVMEEPACVQKDDSLVIFDKMFASDVIVYATPLYFWNFSSQMKTLIDRQYCLTKGQAPKERKSFLNGKHIALLATCGGPDEENADHLKGVFDKVGNYNQCTIVGKYIVPFSFRPDFEKNTNEVANRMAQDVLNVELR
ncbi:MAG: flavodoxin family protein [Deltaproteobacteria bacterium]|nr:flavodoxin family protein [Deltaproteobacteria bacterium]